MSEGNGEGSTLIRELRWEDFTQMAENYRSYYDELEQNPEFGLILEREKPSESRQVEWFSKLYRDFKEGRTLVRVAEIDGRIAGDCDIRMRRDLEGVGHTGTLDIAVAGGFRGMGIGRRLMQAILTEASREIEIVYLDVLSANEAAKRLYASMGFAQCGSFPGMIRRKGKYYDVERMYLRLA